MSGPDLKGISDAAYARGRAEERAAIVAWLRAQGAAIPYDYDHFHQRESCRVWADTVEAGLHHLKGAKNGE